VKPLPKKEFTSFDASAVVHEMQEVLLNSRVNNVYQLDTKTLLFKLHKTNAPPLRLVMEAGRRIHLTAYALEKPLVPPAFCMALRKYLRSAWLSSVEQYEFERIIIFHFKTKEGIVRLILELFGEGNIILTNEKGEILQALVFKRMRDRNILRGEVFKFPPSSGKNPIKLTREDLENALKTLGDVEVVRALARSIGVGGVYAEEILLRANVEKTKHCNTLTNSEANAIFDCLQSLLSVLSNFTVDPHIVLAEDSSFIDAVPFKLKRYENFKIQAHNSFNEALDEFYVRATVAEKAVESSKVDGLKRQAEKLKRVIAEQEQALHEAESKVERDKHIGDVIYAHSTELQFLLDKFSNERSAGKDWNTVITEVLAAKRSGKMPEALVESFDARNLAVNVSVDNLHFSVNLRRTLFENAAEFYERGKKAKQKAAGATAALEESRQKYVEVEQKMSEAETLQREKPAEALKELVKRKVESKQWYEKFRWFTSSDGFLIVAGKDVVSNEVLVKKYAMVADVVFHAEITGAPFVVVKTEGKQPSEQTLREAGEFAAAFSRAWREGFGSADVYWIKPDQLSKSGPSGEYVPHGAFAVNGKRNWLRNMPLRIAIGIIDDGGVQFVGGALEAVKAKAGTYVVLEPGDNEGKELLKQVLRALMAKLPKEQREKVGTASIEQIREFVPFTRGRITET
jgi:predicted ribosome quality control (RQC) complex YloA/Tae2 family protein